MSMFAGATNFDVHGGSFQIQKQHYWGPQIGVNARDGFEYLKQACAFGASHDAAERFPPPKCHPDTRRAVVETIHNWIKSPAPSAGILWLYGPAGVGKSAIAQTVAEECQAETSLVASFFFSRLSQDRNDEKPLVATLAYQLIVSIPDLKPLIVEAVKRDPLVLRKSLEVQVTELLVKPIKKARGVHWLKMRLFMRLGLRRWPTIVIIDGLDECIDRQTQWQNRLGSKIECNPNPVHHAENG